jgi:hypothetical protein
MPARSGEWLAGDVTQATCHLAHATYHLAQASCHLARLLALPVVIMLPPDHAYCRQHPSAARWIWREAENSDKLRVCQPGQAGGWPATCPRPPATWPRPPALPVFILLLPDNVDWRQHPSAVRWIWMEAENLDKLWVCQPGQAGGWQAM